MFKVLIILVLFSSNLFAEEDSMDEMMKQTEKLQEMMQKLGGGTVTGADAGKAGTGSAGSESDDYWANKEAKELEEKNAKIELAEKKAEEEMKAKEKETEDNARHIASAKKESERIKKSEAKWQKQHEEKLQKKADEKYDEERKLFLRRFRQQNSRR